MIEISNSTSLQLQQPFSETIRAYMATRSNKFVFIMGTARSGTTLIFDYLNESNEMLLLNEDNAYSGWTKRHFVRWYNDMWLPIKGVKAKGYWIPPILPDNCEWFDVYAFLSENYRVAGSKLAIGPHGDVYLADVESNLLDFYARYFPAANYFLTIRKPSESILSMSKMFPGVVFGTFKDVWIRTLKIQLSMFSLLKNARFVFHDAVDMSCLRRLADKLLVEVSHANDDYCAPLSERTSYIGAEAVASEILALDEVQTHELAELEEAFTFMKQVIDPSTGTARLWVHTQQLVRELVGELEKLRSNPTSSFAIKGTMFHESASPP